jgi:hypothetical protein
MKDIFEGLDIPTEVQETLSERIKSEVEAVKEGVKNDAEFIDKIRSESTGKFFGSMERVFGRNFADLDNDKYADLQGIKKMEAMLKDGINSLAETKDATSQEWQQKYIESQASFKKYQEEEVPSILDQERNSFYQRFIADEILKDSLEFDTVCSNDGRVPLVEAYLNKNKYHAKWNSTDNRYDILTADNVRVTKNDKVLSNKEVIADAFEFSGVLVKNNGKPEEIQQPGQPMIRANGKLSANAQRMKDTMRVD